MSESSIVNVGLVQMRCAEDPQTNLRKALEMTREAAARGAHIVCLPELFRSRYFCQTEDHERFKLAEPIPGPSTEAFAASAEEIAASSQEQSAATQEIAASAQALATAAEICSLIV